MTTPPNIRHAQFICCTVGSGFPGKNANTKLNTRNAKETALRTRPKGRLSENLAGKRGW
jgi:hypothetical protein